QEQTINHFVKLAKQNKIVIQYKKRQDIERQVDKKAVHQGILADVIPYQYADLEQTILATKKKEKIPFFVLLDQLQDPRNLGAILRTADCCGGIDGVIITKHHSVEMTATVLKTS